MRRRQLTEEPDRRASLRGAQSFFPKLAATGVRAPHSAVRGALGRPAAWKTGSRSDHFS